MKCKIRDHSLPVANETALLLATYSISSTCSNFIQDGAMDGHRPPQWLLDLSISFHTREDNLTKGLAAPSGAGPGQRFRIGRPEAPGRVAFCLGPRPGSGTGPRSIRIWARVVSSFHPPCRDSVRPQTPRASRSACFPPCPCLPNFLLTRFRSVSG